MQEDIYDFIQLDEYLQNRARIVDRVEKRDVKSMCYFTNWSSKRSGIGKYSPIDIESNQCTHIIYSNAVLDDKELVIKMENDIDADLYNKVMTLKSKGVKVLIALGGWNESSGDKYSRLVADPSARKRFVKSVLEFIEEHGFDGLDMNWEYPVCWQVYSTF